MDAFESPIGHNLIHFWHPTGHRGFGLISVPSSSEPVVVEWEEYECPEDPDVEPEMLGEFSWGGTPLTVKERYEDLVFSSQGELRGKHRDDADRVCCSEIARVLATGDPVVLEPIERGAYRGMWRGDVYAEMTRPVHDHEAPFTRVAGETAEASDADAVAQDESDAPNMVYEETACRIVLDLPRRRVTLFRWRCRTFDPDDE